MLISLKLANAQELKKIQFGVKLLGGSAAIGGNYLSNSQSAFTSTNSLGGGVFADYEIIQKFFLQSGISILSKGFAMAEFVDYLDAQNNYQSTATVFSYKPIYIEIPINAVLKLPLGKGNVQLGGGPYFAYAVGGKVKQESINYDNNRTTKKDKLKIGNSATDAYAPVDYGLNFLVGYQLKSGLFLDVSFAPGFANIIPKEQRIGKRKAINGTGLLNLGFEF